MTARVLTHVVILIVILATYSVMDVQGEITSSLLQALSFNDPGSLKATDWFNLLFNTNAGIIASLALLASITIGLFRQVSFDFIIVATFVTTLGGWVISDLIGIFLFYQNGLGTEFSWFVSIMQVLTFAFAGSFLVSIISWWRNSD